jgi:hypothetical protein
LSCRRFATSTFSARNAVTTCQQRASISTERQAVERAGAGERLGGRRRAHQRRHIQLEPQARSSCPVPPPERRRERQVGQAGEPQPGITSSYQMGAATGMWGATQGGRRLQGTLWVARASAKALAHRRRPRPNVVDRRPPPLQTQCPEALSQLRALSAARFPIGHHRQAVAGREASKNAASEQAVEWGSPARSGCRAGCGVAGSRRENFSNFTPELRPTSAKPCCVAHLGTRSAHPLLRPRCRRLDRPRPPLPYYSCQGLKLGPHTLPFPIHPILVTPLPTNAP